MTPAKTYVLEFTAVSRKLYSLTSTRNIDNNSGVTQPCQPAKASCTLRRKLVWLLARVMNIFSRVSDI